MNLQSCLLNFSRIDLLPKEKNVMAKLLIWGLGLRQGRERNLLHGPFPYSQNNQQTCMHMHANLSDRNSNCMLEGHAVSNANAWSHECKMPARHGMAAAGVGWGLAPVTDCPASTSSTASKILPVVSCHMPKHTQTLEKDADHKGLHSNPQQKRPERHIQLP